MTGLPARAACLAAALAFGAACAGAPAAADAVQRLPNPFVGVKGYVNPRWREHVLSEPGGEPIADESTAIWLDSIADIPPAPDASTGGKRWGLAGYLDDALAQQANLIMIVLYDLPNRDCAALASSGELLISQNGLSRYEHEYIDAIVNIVSQKKYRSLRVIAIIEPDSLPNLVTNLDVPACREAAGPGGYADAVRYALDAFYPLRNVYSYVDIGHSGWMGWNQNLDKAATLIAGVIKGTAHGVRSVAGFISNTANYTPLEEPWLEPYEMRKMPGNPGEFVRQARFYGWNPDFGELDYARDFRAKMTALGFPDGIGMLIDTSRNGWGGPQRPHALSRSTDLNQLVDESRIDRRTDRGMWCNQPGGIGERPRADPEPGIAAYVWAKPPGESDGIAMPGIPDPADPAKKFDRDCDPTYAPTNGGGQLTGALPGAPHAGHWFSAGFHVLLENAWPPVR